MNLYKMHKIQQELLSLYNQNKEAFKDMRVVDMQSGCPSAKYPSQIKHHLRQLELKGFLSGDVVNYENETATSGSFVDLPIYGSADCGQALTYSDNQEVQGHVRVSKNLLKYSHDYSSLYIMNALGDSMNQANINGKSIDSGDYLVVTSKVGNVKDGDIVVSIIDNLANIKKFKKVGNQIKLMPESSNKKHKPIFISSHDKYMISGKVVDVLKNN